MVFRSEIEAARARIAALEERVRTLEVPQVDHRPHPRIAWLPMAGCALLAAVAFGLAMLDKDAPAWIAANLCVVTGIGASLWSWGRVGRALPAWLFVLVKTALPFAMGWGWWSPRYGEVSQAVSWRSSLNFFWYIQTLILAILLLEGLLIWRSLRLSR